MTDDMATTLSKAIGEIARLPKSSIGKVRIGQDDTDGFEVEWRADLISFRLTYDPAAPELSLRLDATISSPGENTADVSEGATVREALDDMAAKREWQAEHIRELLGQSETRGAAKELAELKARLAGFRAYLTEETRLNVVDDEYPCDESAEVLSEFNAHMSEGGKA